MLTTLGGPTMRLRTLTAATTVITASLTGAALVAAPAQAADGTGSTFNIRSITVAPVHVRSTNCVNTPMHVVFDTGAAQGGETDYSADVEFWRGSRQVDSQFLYDTITTSSGTASIDDSYLYCPWELGTMTAGPSEVSATSYDADYDELASEYFTDFTRGTFIARQDARTSLTTARLSGGRTRFTSIPTYFSLDSAAWRRWNYKPMTLQKQASSGAWTNVAALKTTSRGVATKVVTTKRGLRYRVVTTGSTVTWASTSPTRTS